MRYQKFKRRFPKVRIQDQSLGNLTTKKDFTFFDLIIILSTMYGIGAALGIIAGTSKNILPEREKKPVMFASCIALLALGVNRGWATAKRADEVKRLLSDMDIETLKEQIIDIQNQVQDKINVR